MEHPTFHRRNLPHLHNPTGNYFITYRLAGSLPANVIAELKKEIENPINKEKTDIKRKKIFAKYDSLLDGSTVGPLYLSNSKIAIISKNSLHFYDKREYDLICYCIMPNHIHVVFSLLINSRDVSQIMQSIKRFSARESNKILNQKGNFWHAESYDRLIRNQKEFDNIVNYVVQNPVKAGLVKHWKDWQWTYCCPELCNTDL